MSVDTLEAQGKIKPNLFLFDPEQTSDLVIVPLAEDIAVFLSGLFASGSVDNYSVDTRWVNLPFAVNVTDTGRLQPSTLLPLLFQRFNSSDKPFADGYSKKLFDFYYQFGNHYILTRSTSFARTVLTQTSSFIRDINLFSLGSSHHFGDRTINTIDNGLSIEISYYYAQEVLESDRVFYFPRYYEYPRHRNNCISTPHSRQWLLNFETITSNGESFPIRDDILIGSLVIKFIDNPSTLSRWRDEDKAYILSQIPDYYLYENLDEFFTLLTNQIVNRIPSVFEELEFFKSSQADIVFSRFNSTDITIEGKIYEQSTLDLKTGLIIYANNNQWNNTYSWISNSNTIHDDFNQFISLIENRERVNLYDDNGNFVEQIERLEPYFLAHGFGTNSNTKPFFYVLNQGQRNYYQNGVEFRQQSRITNSYMHFGGVVTAIIYDSMNAVQFVKERGSKDADIPNDSGGDYVRTSFYYYNFGYSSGTYESSAFEVITQLFTNSTLQGQESLDNIRFENVEVNDYILATEVKTFLDDDYINNLVTLVIQAHKNCYKVCPTNTCAVDCGEHICCYGSDGIAIDYFIK